MKEIKNESTYQQILKQLMNLKLIDLFGTESVLTLSD